MNTLAKHCTFSGIGIHSGKTVTITLKPSTLGQIRFIRTDIDAIIPITKDTLKSTPRATLLATEEARILTPEHLIAALYAFGISSCDIEIDNEEVPILDGSSKHYCETIEKSGVAPLKTSPSPIVINDIIEVRSGDAFIKISPAKETSFSYTLSYPNHFIGTQQATFKPHNDNFITEIAPARTYGFYDEVKSLLDKGLAQGGSLDNAVVIKDDGYMQELRFENELARHKLLDLLGDLWLLGRPIIGKVEAYKSGHALTAELVKALNRDAQVL